MRRWCLAAAAFLLANMGIDARLPAQQHEPHLAWRTIKTAHFSIHFPRGHEKIAHTVAAICEEVYEPVSRSLNYFPQRTEVVIHTRSDIPNGFVTNLPWRMELYLNEPQDNLLGSGESWLRILIAHEFTHVVQGRKVRGLTLLTYPFFGELNALWHSFTPGWYAEGFATLNETRFTTGGRGRNPAFAMKMWAPLLNDNPWRLDNTNYVSRKRVPADMQYVTGYYLADYIAAQYGEDTWAKIIDRYSELPILGFGHAVKHATGKSHKTLYRELLATSDSIRATDRQSLQYWKPVAVPEYQYSPRWLDENRIIYFSSSYGQTPRIAVLRRSGEVEKVVERQLFQAEHGLSARENLLVWSEIVRHPRFFATESAELVLYDIAARQQRFMTRGARLFSPDLAPDTSRIVAVQHEGGETRLVVLRVEDAAVEPVLQIDGAGVFNPRWSPDSRLIAFAVKDSSYRQNIAVFDPVSGEWRYLYPPDRFHDNAPCWTPDGRHVLFASDRSGRFNIWAVEVETGRLWMVTNVTTGAFTPDVSPSGRELAFTVYTELGNAIATQPLSASWWQPQSGVALRPVVAASNSPASPAASSTGDGIGVARRYNPFGQIWRPQGWFPVALDDEGGTAAGLFMVSEDALHRHAWQGYLAFSTANLKPSWDLSYTYQRWWPALTLRSYSEAERIAPFVFQGREYRGWFRENGLSLTASIPLLLRNNVYATTFQPFFGIRAENRHISAGNVLELIEGDTRRDYRGFRTGFQFVHLTQTLRDVVPRAGVVAALQSEWSADMLGNDFSAQQTTSILTTYVPTLIRHHQLQLETVLNLRQGNFAYDSFRAYPIGYHNPGFRKQWRLKAAYHLPLAYVEWEVPLLPLYFDVLTASLFYDWGTFWNRGFGASSWGKNGRFATGATISGRFRLLQLFRTSIGLAGFYRSATGDFRIEPVIGLQF